MNTLMDTIQQYTNNKYTYSKYEQQEKLYEQEELIHMYEQSDASQKILINNLLLIVTGHTYIGLISLMQVQKAVSSFKI